jgi:hypothetical protein
VSADADVPVQRAAEVSPDGLYRYSLTRRGGEAPPVRWIMLNPSTADANADDPTIRRCMSFARDWGAGGIVVHNLFAYRTTDPYRLRMVVDPVGPGNDARLVEPLEPGTRTVCAWGTGGALEGRAVAVRGMLVAAGVELWCLGRTGAGHPRHPLYLRRETPLELFAP